MINILSQQAVIKLYSLHHYDVKICAFDSFFTQHCQIVYLRLSEHNLRPILVQITHQFKLHLSFCATSIEKNYLMLSFLKICRQEIFLKFYNLYFSNFLPIKMKLYQFLLNKINLSTSRYVKPLIFIIECREFRPQSFCIKGFKPVEVVNGPKQI